ncbi:mannose-6-phosphate isomerase, class I [Vagococcus sp.]|uniref:mannose-6-phosphate isomerase, class I n=1 Tax=Vagococcus sp. TaxID=1933889 RepID=UPI003F9C7E72
MKEPLFLKPVFQEKIWGGNQLQTSFNYELPSDKTGECWAISAHPHGVSTVINGKFKGTKLDELWKKESHLFGNPKEPVFPLLIKILDAEDDLSVQVHPDDEYGKKHAGELGKTECWYIIDAKPGAEIIYGHHAQTREELIEMIDKGQWDQLLTRVPVKRGDFFFVPSGTIHAIGKGIMILETQQSSDTTYRVYDYDRKDDEGNLRELHIQESIDVTQVPHHIPVNEIKQVNVGSSSLTTFLQSDYFCVYDWEIEGSTKFEKQAPYTLASVLNGFGYLFIEEQEEPFELKKGDHFILPNEINNWKIEGDIQLIASTPGSKNSK